MIDLVWSSALGELWCVPRCEEGRDKEVKIYESLELGRSPGLTLYS
jgi:hypothetical protein